MRNFLRKLAMPKPMKEPKLTYTKEENDEAAKEVLEWRKAHGWKPYPYPWPQPKQDKR